MNVGLSCYFTYPQGSSAIFPGLGDNAAELERLDAFVAQALSYPDLSISRIRLTGYCSVEGGAVRNEALSYERVEGFYRYLYGHYPRLSRYPYDRAWVGEDWDGLSEYIKSSPISEREEVLEIIRVVREYDDREALLAKLNGGQAWLFMEREIFPRLRRVELRIEYGTKAGVSQFSPVERMEGRAASDVRSTGENWETPDKESDAARSSSLRSTAHEASPRPKASPRPSPKEREENHAASSSPSPLERVGVRLLKTNLLLWAGVQSDFSHTTPVANVALEYFITPDWSVEAGVLYSYWRFNSNREFQGVSGYRLEARRRLAFPDDRFGAYLGLYGRVGDYDRRTLDLGQWTVDNPDAGDDDDFPQSTLNYTGNYWDAGVSAGFTLRLAGNLGLEAGVRAGYVSSRVTRYVRVYDHNLYRSERGYHKLNVTDLNLSLVYKIW
jgi:hypothetical protein